MKTEEQRLHWDQKYQEEMASLTRPDPFFLSAYAEFVEDSFPNAGIVLDLAGGLGRHALWLASRRWRVNVVDLSEVAISRLRQSALQLHLPVDLFAMAATDYQFQPAQFDLIVLFYHLDRGLCEKIVSALKPGGVLICKTSLQWDSDKRSTWANSGPLERSEILSLVPDLSVMYHRERPVLDRGVVEFVGRKPAATPELQIAAVPKLKAIRHKEIIETGSLPEMVHEISKRQCVDLIVAGSHGADGIEKMLLGSMAEALLRHAACPVLVLGPLASAELSIKSVLYATDLELGSFRSAQFAASLAGKLNSRLTLLHVSQKEVAPTETWMLLADQAAKRLCRLLPADVKDGCAPKIRVELGDAAGEILGVAREENADLIVMGVREHGGFADHAPWHTLSKVIRKASCPVLAVRGNLLGGKLLHNL